MTWLNENGSQNYSWRKCHAKQKQQLLSMKTFFNLYYFGKGWPRLLGNAQVLSPSRNGLLSSVISFLWALVVLWCAQGWQTKLRSPQISKFVWLPLDFIIWLQKKKKNTTAAKTQWHEIGFRNLQATTAPLRRLIISLRLLGAAPVFSCIVLLKYTWCIARLHTMG